MNRQELRATGALAAIFAMRLLGLFMIYRVFLGYAQHLHGATPRAHRAGAWRLRTGTSDVADSFGLRSDPLGRKLIIGAGLGLFALGSVVVAMATTIDGVLVGRILQGTGAVDSAVLALVADLTREEVRTRATALVGIMIGFTFVIAIAAGPVLASASAWPASSG